MLALPLARRVAVALASVPSSVKWGLQHLSHGVLEDSVVSYVQGLSAVPDAIVRASSVGTVCGTGPSPDRICDGRRMKPNTYPEGMKRDYCSYNEAFWESSTGSQAGLKMNQESRSRSHGSAVTFCVWQAGLV